MVHMRRSPRTSPDFNCVATCGRGAGEKMTKERGTPPAAPEVQSWIGARPHPPPGPPKFNVEVVRARAVFRAPAVFLSSTLNLGGPGGSAPARACLDETLRAWGTGARAPTPTDKQVAPLTLQFREPRKGVRGRRETRAEAETYSGKEEDHCPKRNGIEGEGHRAIGGGGDREVPGEPGPAQVALLVLVVPSRLACVSRALGTQGQHRSNTVAWLRAHCFVGARDSPPAICSGPAGAGGGMLETAAGTARPMEQYGTTM
jgi:hypothetical protein